MWREVCVTFGRKQFVKGFPFTKFTPKLHSNFTRTRTPQPSPINLQTSPANFTHKLHPQTSTKNFTQSKSRKAKVTRAEHTVSTRQAHRQRTPSKPPPQAEHTCWDTKRTTHAKHTASTRNANYPDSRRVPRSLRCHNETPTAAG